MKCENLAVLLVFLQNAIALNAASTVLQNVVSQYTKAIEMYEQKIRNLTIKVEHMESTSVSYTELDFQLLKLEINEMERLVTQLKSTLVGSNVIVEQLYVEIKNLTLMVNDLESSEKNNILAIHQEIVALQNRLKECEKHRNQTTTPFCFPPAGLHRSPRKKCNLFPTPSSEGSK
ncbi:olfactomedin-4-like [Chrysemys picta bellii]|uniref:olfactomedin-4-like n=1 Tax=Chrysemys picta bellii TaxID=8478 RepID=UPI0032B11941